MIPGEDYLTVVGEDLCALGESFAEIINDQVGSGKVGVMGGTPGNALSLGWEQCYLDATDTGIKNLGPADTYWANDVALQTVNGWLSTDPDIKGYVYEYADGLNTALAGLRGPGHPDRGPHGGAADRRADPVLHVEEDGRSQLPRLVLGGRQLPVPGRRDRLDDESPRGGDPAEIVVPHVMREVTAADCNPDRVTPTVSNTSLVPDALLAEMYPNG